MFGPLGGWEALQLMFVGPELASSNVPWLIIQVVIRLVSLHLIAVASDVVLDLSTVTSPTHWLADPGRK